MSADDAGARIQATIDRRVASGAEVGVQVVVVEHGRVLVDAVSGFADPAQGQVVAPNTLFYAASAAKGMASTAAMCWWSGASSHMTCGRPTSGPSSAPTARIS
jgi:CubicO group peptidase (beta-lactamase class C family)